MLIPIKNYYVDGIPNKEDLAACQEICIKENCLVELRWLPSTWAGWYHLYINKETDIEYAYEHQVPKVYAV